MIQSGSLKILFLLIKSRINKEGKAPIYCKLTLNNSNLRFSIGQNIPIKQWSQSSQLALGKSPLAQEVNSKIQEVKKRIFSIEFELSRENKEVTLQEIISKYQNKNNTPFKTLIQAYNYKYAQMESLVGKNYSKGTVVKARQLQKSLEDFLKLKMMVNDIPIGKVNNQFLQEFEHYLIANKQFSIASLNKTIQKLKSIMKMAYEYGVIDRPAFPNHKFKHQKNKIIYLTVDELDKLEKFKFSQERLDKVRSIFLFSVYTGLHYSDAMSLKKSQIRKGIDNKDWIIYTRSKTSIEVQIPVLEKTKNIITHLGEIIKDDEYLLPKISNQKINSYLKEIAEIVGIDKPLSHKIARKTFGSVLLYYNVPMKVVSKLMGHSSVLITEKHYADVELRKLGEEMGRVDGIFK